VNGGARKGKEKRKNTFKYESAKREREIEKSIAVGEAVDDKLFVFMQGIN
jgi:hypothetical protein